VSPNTEARYRTYDQTCEGRCPSCRATWTTTGNGWQAVHKDACKYIAWWLAKYNPTATIAA
jgi:hypothetical protein